MNNPSPADKEQLLALATYAMERTLRWAEDQEGAGDPDVDPIPSSPAEWLQWLECCCSQLQDDLREGGKLEWITDHWEMR